MNAFSSGMYRTWNYDRHVGVCAGKPCGRIFVKGLKKALLSGKITEACVQLNWVRLKGFSFDGDRLVLDEPLLDGNYRLSIRLTFDDIEPARYW